MAVGFLGGQLVLGMGVQRVSGFTPAPSAPAVVVVWHTDMLTLQPGQPTSSWSRDLQGLNRQREEGIASPGMGVGRKGDFLQPQGTCIGPTAKAGKATRDQVVKGLEWWAEKCEDH